MDVISLIIGFAIGMIVVGIAIELGTKRTTGTAPASRHAKNRKSAYHGRTHGRY